MPAREFSLFPLGTVLFPGGPLPLRIFEPRYIDMVSHCLRNDEPFGVCLIRAGREVGQAAAPFETGTLAKIVDWDRGDDGLLSLTALGTSRFRIRRTWVQEDQLLKGECELLDEARIALPAQAKDLGTLVERIMSQAHPSYAHTTLDLEDAAWVSYRLAELMPLPMTAKQRLLEQTDPVERLDDLRRALHALEAHRNPNRNPPSEPED